MSKNKQLKDERLPVTPEVKDYTKIDDESMFVLNEPRGRSGEFNIRKATGQTLKDYFSLLSVESGITAVGSSATDAYKLTKKLNIISTGAGTTGVQLPNAKVGNEVKIVNLSASDKLIYPFSGDQIDDKTATTGSVSIKPEDVVTFYCYNVDQWQTDFEADDVYDILYIKTLDAQGNADAIVLDGDGDTTISAPTDDQIDIEVGGSDVVTITSTNMTLDTGLDLNGGILTFDADGDSNFNFGTDDSYLLTLGGILDENRQAGIVEYSNADHRTIRIASTSGTAGKNLNLHAGKVTAGNFNGGNFNLFSGDGFGSGDSGSFSLRSNPPGATGNSGSLEFYSGDGGATSGNSGDINFYTGTVSSGTRGAITMSPTIKVGLAASDTIGLFGATPIAQPNGTGETTGHAAVGGTNVNASDTFTGNTGTLAYTINDVVKALKNLGILEA